MKRISILLLCVSAHLVAGKKSEKNRKSVRAIYEKAWNGTSTNPFLTRYIAACGDKRFSDIMYEKATMWMQESVINRTLDISTVYQENVETRTLEIIKRYYFSHKDEVYTLMSQWEKNEGPFVKEVKTASITEDGICNIIHKQMEVDQKKREMLDIMKELRTLINTKYSGAEYTDTIQTLYTIIAEKIENELVDKPLSEIRTALVEYIENGNILLDYQKVLLEDRKKNIQDKARALLTKGGPIAGILPVCLKMVKSKEGYIQAGEEEKLELDERALEKLESAATALLENQKIQDKTIKELVFQWKVDNNIMTEQELEELLVVYPDCNDYVIKTNNPKKRELVLDYAKKKYEKYEEHPGFLQCIEGMYSSLAIIYSQPEDKDQYELKLQEIDRLLKQLKPRSQKSFDNLLDELQKREFTLWKAAQSFKIMQQENSSEIEMPELGVTFGSSEDAQAFARDLHEMQVNYQTGGDNLPHDVTVHSNLQSSVTYEDNSHVLQNRQDKKKQKKLTQKLERWMSRVEEALLDSIIQEAEEIVIKEENEHVQTHTDKHPDLEYDGRNSSILSDAEVAVVTLTNPLLSSSADRKKIIEKAREKHIQDFDVWKHNEYNKTVIALQKKYKF